MYGMKIYILSFILAMFCGRIFAQTHDSALTRSEFHREILRLSEKITTLEKYNSDLKKANYTQKKQVDSIGSKLSVTDANMQKIADSLHITLTNVSSANEKTQGQIQDINHTITNRTLYWIIGILAVSLLSMAVFFVLRNRLLANTKNFDSQITHTNETLQNEAIKLDSKLVEILQTQLSIVRDERKTSDVVKTDHKLPLKVGEEIHRMRKRIEAIPREVKGLNALSNSLQRLEEEFNESGYEMEDLLGKKYVDGLKMEARFVDDPSIPKGEEMITDVLRPEIKYKGVVIQVAKVEVGKSY